MKISIGGQAIGIGGTALSLPMPRITVSGKNLVRAGVTFKAFGVQPLYHEWIIDYFREGGAAERLDVDSHMRGARVYGANTFRIHLDLWHFISGANYAGLAINTTAFDNFIYLLNAAKKQGIYVLVSGNNCWKIEDVPAWYDTLAYADRWDVQQYFFEQLAQAVLDSGNSTTVLGYELLSEPTITDNAALPYYWGDVFEVGLYYVQHIARGVVEASQPAVVQAWITQLSGAIKAIDPNALVTIGLISIGGPNFGPDNIEGLLDFLSPHLYPPGYLETDLDLDTAEMWAASTLPVVIGESENLNFTEQLNRDWMDAVMPTVQGYVTFYWGYGPEKHTTAPAVPRLPAPADTDALIYALHAYSLRISAEYRADFLDVA